MSQLINDFGFLSSNAYARHYGQFEGRDILDSLEASPPESIIVLSPSHLKRCGIGEYGRYLIQSFEDRGYSVRIVRRSQELENIDDQILRSALCIVNHGPGLFDGYNPLLSEGEPTLRLALKLRRLYELKGLRSIIFMHSLLGKDNEEMFGRQLLLLNSNLPIVTTIKAAALTFKILHVEHGVQPIPSNWIQQNFPDFGAMKIGFFGFFQYGGKDFDTLIDIARVTRSTLVGSVATSSKWELEKLDEYLTRDEISSDISTGWVTDEQLTGKLTGADIFYMPQKDYDHWNNSGTARLVMNFCRPVLLPPHQPFLEMSEGVIFSEGHDLPAVMAHLRNKEQYSVASDRAAKYAKRNGMEKSCDALIASSAAALDSINIDCFATPSALSLQRLAQLPPHAAQLRLKSLRIAANLWCRATEVPGVTLPHAICDEIQYWRCTYNPSDFLYRRSDDVIFSVYRNLLKREPSWTEYLQAKGVFAGEDFGANDPSLEITCLALMISNSLSQSEERHGCRTPLVLIGDEEIAASDITSIENDLKAAWAAMNTRDVAPTAPLGKTEAKVPEQPTNGRSESYLNIFALAWASRDSVISQLSDYLGIEVNSFPDLVLAESLRFRVQKIVEMLSKMQVDIFDSFVLDAPVVAKVDIARRQYDASELYAHDGDAYIINMYRCLLKRNPLISEFFKSSHILVSRGKAVCLDALLIGGGINAELNFNRDECKLAVDLWEGERQRLYRDLRSPIAGGWSRRNAYLIEKRDFSRCWLANKALDSWWTQQGATPEGCFESSNLVD